MLLALDVGNTNITIGVFKRKEIIEVFRITTKLPRTSDEFGILISNLLKEKGLIKKELDGLKILGNGNLTKKLTVRADKFTNSAKAKIENIGGEIEVI